jgi:hypothetical protein
MNRGIYSSHEHPFICAREGCGMTLPVGSLRDAWCPWCERNRATLTQLENSLRRYRQRTGQRNERKSGQNSQ